VKTSLRALLTIGEFKFRKEEQQLLLVNFRNAGLNLLNNNDTSFAMNPDLLIDADATFDSVSGSIVQRLGFV